MWIKKIVILVVVSTNIYSQQRWSIGFYNVENLFDTVDNADKNDEEFLPSSEKKWDTYKYWNKLKKISKVIRNMTGENPPILMGLCEVENELVLRDLVNRDPIKKHKYGILTYPSPDKRGIRVALLYKEDYFEVLSSEQIEISDPKNDFFTRDILYVKGKLINEDTIHIFVNHWPSRRGGKNNTEYKRIKASDILVNRLNNIVGENLNIVICGDFNDEPFDISIKKIVSHSRHKLINMSEKSEETYVFKGYSGIIDQIIVSENLYKKSVDKNSKVFKNVFLIDKNSKYNSPLSTYRGPFYVGGFSDHFPVSLTLEY